MPERESVDGLCFYYDKFLGDLEEKYSAIYDDKHSASKGRGGAADIDWSIINQEIKRTQDTNKTNKEVGNRYKNRRTESESHVKQ